MARTIVGVLRGGTSGEYDASLKTGAVMLAALPEDRYETRDIFIDRNGYWHLRGVPAEPSRILAQIDVVLNGLHGGAGEDGTVQRILERHGTDYAGSRAHSAALSHNKARTMEIARAANILTPRGIALGIPSDMTTGDMAHAVFANFGPPYIVKPPLEGSSQGIILVSTIIELPHALGETLDRFGSALVQEFIRGENARVGIIEGFRGQELYALPPAHMLKPEGKEFVDAETRQQGLVKHVVPSNFSNDEKRSLEEAAKAAYRALGLVHFSRADFILSRGKAYLLEVTSLPGLYEGAAFPQMLEAVGSSVPEFLEHAISLARQ
ncbi:MAG TPA: ATP-grasp domain-containing protein [Candidatus Paceibacterota bacterium]|jgi:D-alanine-D-alanine ligase|nr:ATP-grasp domain-containing protein [Candidatus Paceibacterota bacterium]